MTASRTRKAIGLLFGLLFIGLGVVVVVVADAPNRVASFLVAVALVALGIDQVVGTLRGRTSFLERIGPLP